MTNEPSPRPWRAEPMFNGVADARGEKVAANIRCADAALIVDAVNAIDETKKLSIKLYDPIRRAEAERDRLRDIVKRTVETLEQVYKHADMTDSLREVVVETQREAIAAIGEDKE